MPAAGDAAFLRVWGKRYAALVDVISVESIGASTFAVVEARTPILDWSVADAAGAPWPLMDAGARFSCLADDLVPIPYEIA